MSTKTPNYNLTKPSDKDFYDINVHNGNMDIIDAELKNLNNNKAPSGFGLGDVGKELKESYKNLCHKGGGFYQIINSSDSPDNTNEWLGVIQNIRSTTAGLETGAQLAFYDWYVNNPKMYFRTLLKGEPSDWVEILHTGNIEKHTPSGVEVLSYKGTGTYGVENKCSVTFAKKPKMLMILDLNYDERHHILVPYGVPSIAVRYTDSVSRILYFNYSDKTISWYSENGENEQRNVSGHTTFVIGLG